MIRNEPLTAIIPARGGSKGVPKKNLYRIDGDTLVERAIRLARESGRVDRVLVTTDDPEIYAIAKAHDAAPPSLRPSALATDDARTIDAVQHLIADAKVTGGYLLLLQPTSPLRTAEDLKALCAQLEAHPEADAITSVASGPSALLTTGGVKIGPILYFEISFSPSARSSGVKSIKLSTTNPCAS